VALPVALPVALVELAEQQVVAVATRAPAR
jgi:hypothetical protein